MYTTLALYSSLSSPTIDRTTFHSKSEAQTVNVIEQLPLICTVLDQMIKLTMGNASRASDSLVSHISHTQLIVKPLHTFSTFAISLLLTFRTDLRPSKVSLVKSGPTRAGG